MRQGAIANWSIRGAQAVVRERGPWFSKAVGGALAILVTLFTAGCGNLDSEPNETVEHARAPLTAITAATSRVVARGIIGAGAIAQVGAFLPGGPLHDRAAFIPFTQPGQVLDRHRLLVASTSNYGASRGRSDEAAGSVLSIDASASNYVVPSSFAASGGQAATTDGVVRVYAANNAAFANSINNPGAVTAGEVAISLPTGLSFNNGSGRPWVSNAPTGAAGQGTITVLDPNGTPLAGAPDLIAGGVFAGDQTNRNAASTHGLVTGALGTALLTKSPDLSGRAVFAAVEADGSVVQVHVQQGVDGLAPPGTVSPCGAVTAAILCSNDPHTVGRMGMLFNWVPTRNLIIADPPANRLVVLDLSDDGTSFSVSNVRTITATTTNWLIDLDVLDILHLNVGTVASSLDWPVDIAPATREVASANFASNTTLGGGSDFYVLNRGNNTIVRMSLSGQVIDARQITSSLTDFRANGIAVSEDGQTIWVTVNLPNQDGAVLELAAFGAPQPSSALVPQAIAAGASDLATVGQSLFSHAFTLGEGVGPLFNAQSCVGCHAVPFVGGMGISPAQEETVFARTLSNGTYDPMLTEGGPVARAHSISEIGGQCNASGAPPPDANIFSTRNAMTLRGNGLLDTIVLGDALNQMALEPAAVRGRPNLLPDGRWGKFGWKANIPTLVEFMAEGFRNELGITSPLRPQDLTSACGADQNSPEADALLLQATAAFLNNLDPPVPTAACLTSTGAGIFGSIGCADCHAPTLPGRSIQIRLYSDLLLHDMGSGLADGIQQGVATGSEWRTMPLWRVSERSKFLHDARSSTIADAIVQHGGQALNARTAFQALDPTSSQALLDFLDCL